MQNKATDTATRTHASTKKLRLIGCLLFIGLIHSLHLTGAFSQAVLTTFEIKYCILLLVNLLSTPSRDPFRHVAICLRCIIILLALYIDPSNYMVSFITTLMNAFFIGMEMDGAFYQIVYSIGSLSPWLISVVLHKYFNVPSEQLSGLIRTACCAIIIYTFICITSAVNRKARLDALKKLEAAYAELRDLNTKNEEMNKELKQLLEDKDNFILLFSHETRNPLNILLGNLTLLLEEVETPSLRTKLLRSKFCAELLLHHLNNILDTGKLTNKNALEVTSVRIRTREYLQSVWDFMEMLLKKKGLKAELLVSKRLPKALMFDPQRLTQILLNLISNAAKFTPRGSVSLNVSYLSKPHLEEADYLPTTIFGNGLTKRDKEEVTTLEDLQEIDVETQTVYFREFQRELLSSRDSFIGVEQLNREENGYLKFEITDTGCGIQAEDLQKLFKKFNQVHAEGSYRQIGSGLGLWITKNLAQLMEGDIRVYSKPNIGTCFVVLIGTKTPPSLRSSLDDNFLSSLTGLTEKPRRKILLADDDPDNLDLHKRLLKNAGWEDLVTATNGKELVELFESQPCGTFYGVITDVYMPMLDGISAAKRIREIEEIRGCKSRVKIGFITGHSNQNDKSICEDSPIKAWFYVSKPVTAVILEGYLQAKKKVSLKTEASMRSDKPLVLCVDDDIFNLEMLEGLLAEFDVSVLKAQGGRQAIEMVKAELQQRRRKIDLVLMDCHMPEMDGWETSQKIKEMTQLNEVNKEIMIIGLSGDKLSDKDEVKLKQSGIQDWVQKPIRRGDLTRIFQKLAK